LDSGERADADDPETAETLAVSRGDEPRPARGAGRSHVIGLLATTAPWLLALWFLFQDIQILTTIVIPYDALGGDGLLYSLGARAWLTGGDPYLVVANGVYLAAPPPTLLPFVLTFWMTPEAMRLVWVVIGFAAIALTVRFARLPLWCLLFPPSVFSALHGSIETVMVLCLVGPAWLAPVIKVYAAIPLLILGRWRSLVGACVTLLVTVPFLPWPAFIDHLPEMAPRLAEQTQGGYSAFGNPLLVVGVLLVLPLLGRRTAAFVLVPSLWPSMPPQYGAMVLPVLDRVPLAGLMGTSRAGVAFGVVVSGLLLVLKRRVGPRPDAADRSHAQAGVDVQVTAERRAYR
jgi:hypothetical protein